MKGKVEILADILSLCASQGTGSFFVVTAENRGSQFVIEEGILTAISSGRLKGKEALEDFETLVVESYSFKEGMIMPLPSKSRVALSLEETKIHILYIQKVSKAEYARSVLARIDEEEKPTALELQDTAKRRGKTYKGISDKKEQSTVISRPQPRTKKNEGRIYRGVVVR